MDQLPNYKGKYKKNNLKQALSEQYSNSKNQQTEVNQIKKILCKLKVYLRVQW